MPRGINLSEIYLFCGTAGLIKIKQHNKHKK